jgi:DNA gyrase/topoisomerase IV subunit B
MSIKINQTNSKEIIALDIFDAVRLRPGMYLGQVSLMDDKIPIIKNNKLQISDKSWSPGFMHLIIEILENALDEAKRSKGKMKNITIKVNEDTNEVTVIDEGNGFHKGEKIHSKTKKNVVRTALEDLHAGSNFNEQENNLLGMHGVGSAIVNILSQSFKVETVNDTHYVKYEWEDFKVKSELIRPKKKSNKSGTLISFIPSNEVFPNFKWDLDIVKTYLSFKSFLIKQDPLINNLTLKCISIKDNKESSMDVIQDFFPKDLITINTSFGLIYLWESYENSGSVSFVNGSQCTGIHQKIVNDWCNEYFGYNLAHHFYETLISLNVPSTLMKFADQNKTKYAITRQEIEEELEKQFKSKLINQLKKSEISKIISKNIEDRLHNENISKIRKAQKGSRFKVSDKFSPASKHKDYIFFTEGNSASGSLLQARNSENDSVYSLRGKVKNTQKLSDLTNNKEIMELMSILNIEPGNLKLPEYKKIIIATDEDCYDKDTLVITKEGNKKIKDISYNDLILTHKKEFKPVERIIKTYKNEYVEIIINGEKLICSSNSFLVIKNENDKIKLILTKDLKLTDKFLNLNRDLDEYEFIKPSSINIFKNKRKVMYDITVKDHHTFFVYLNPLTALILSNCDGMHISSLLINFFYKWFPQIIENKRLYRLTTPLVVCDYEKTRKYFYTIKEYDDFIKDHKVTSVNYLKGLGSLSIEDWQYVMNNKILFQITKDSLTDKFLTMAFGDDSNKRKLWLEN